jgi:hypothetical protein
LGPVPGLDLDLDLDLEIVVGDAQKHLLQARSTRMLRQSIAPKVKRASIMKLNEELEVKIKEQHALVVDERRTGKALLQQESVERKRREQQASDDEFGISEEGEEREGEIENQTKATDQEEKVHLVTRLIDSDDEDIVAQPDFRMKTMPPKKKVTFSDDEELLAHLIEADSPEKDNSFQGLTQILSGQFANETAEEPILEEEQPLESLESGSDQEADTVNRGTTGLIDFEAEDEDSEVSADEIDEDAIAKELQECAFLDDEAASDEMDDSEQFILHRQLKAEEEAAEMEMFMNRFVPDDVLRETGAYAEMRKKYADNDDDDGIGLQGMAGSKSKYGQIRVHNADQAQSHPDFLKLLDQDRLSTGSEPETEDSECGPELGEFDNESELCKNMNPDLGLMDSLLTSSMIINTLTPTSNAKRLHIAIVDEELRARLSAKEKEKDDNQPTADTKRNRTTFETVSSRPVIVKEKMGKK